MIFATLPKTPPAQLYNLVAKFKQGEQHKYKITTAIHGMVPSNRPLTLEFGLDTKVLKMRSGIATIKLSFSQMKSGKDWIPGTYGSSTISLDKSNKPVGSSHTGEVFMIFPGHPVGVGSKWSGLANLMPPGKAGQSVFTTYKLGGVKQDNGRTIASLAMAIQGTTPGEGTALVDLADGTLLAEDLRIIVPDKGKKFPVEIIVRRES
jgi:hypothetical protein